MNEDRKSLRRRALRLIVANGHPVGTRLLVPLHLAQYEGEKLVSRSQTKRVSLGFERYKRVELDFTASPRSDRPSPIRCSASSL